MARRAFLSRRRGSTTRFPGESNGAPIQRFPAGPAPRSRHRRRRDADDGLAGSWLRSGDLLQAHVVDAAENNGSHRVQERLRLRAFAPDRKMRSWSSNVATIVPVRTPHRRPPICRRLAEHPRAYERTTMADNQGVEG